MLVKAKKKPAYVENIETAFGRTFEQSTRDYARLTDREKDVAVLIADGHKSGQIATDLGISTKTLDIHRTNILRKLESKSSVHIGRMVFMFRIAEALKL